MIFNIIFQLSLRLAKVKEVSQKARHNLHVNASMEKREREREGVREWGREGERAREKQRETDRQRDRERVIVIHGWAKSGCIERYYLDSRQSKHFIQTKFL